MEKIIKLTLLAYLTSCLVMFLTYLIINPQDAILFLFFSFGNILIPTLISVIIFRLIIKRVQLSSSPKTIVFQIFIMTLFNSIGILIWAAIDVKLFGELYREEWNIIKEFNAEFKPWLPALFSLAFFIPIINYRIYRIQETN